jgi:hypothetical protein
LQKTMSTRARHLDDLRHALAYGVFVLVVAIALLFFAPLAGAQQPAPPDQLNAAPQAEAAPPAAAPAPTPEIFGAISRAIEQSIGNVGAAIKGATDSLTDTTTRTGDIATNAAKDTVDAVTRLPTARIVSGRERCATAPNGAPDCRAVSEAMCKAQGFGTGQSLDIQSSRKCDAQAWLQARIPNDRECVREAFVVRAVCQ